MRTDLPRRSLASVSTLIFMSLALSGCTAPNYEAQLATPSSTESQPPISAVNHAAGEQDAAVDIEVTGADGVTVTMREIRIAPGAGTGIHCHHGQLIGVVKEGALTHYAPVYDDGVHVYETGDSLVEGIGYQHEGRNEGDIDVVLWVTYVIPEGEPLAETDLSRCEPAP